MPVHATKGGFKFGTSGKTYKSKAKAEAQARAIYSSGWRDDQKAKIARRKLHAALSAPRAAEVRYVRDLKALMKGVHNGVAKMVREELFPLLPTPEPREDGSTKGERPGVGSEAFAVASSLEGVERQDTRWLDGVKKLFSGLGDKIAKHLAPKTGVAFDRMAKVVNENGEKAATLIGIQPKVAGIQDLIDTARDESIGFLETAGRDYADDVRAVLEDPENQFLTVDELSDLLEERAGVSASRATTIATTSTLQLNSTINTERHQAAGITRFVWSTSRDIRVRGAPDGPYAKADPSHYDLEGQEYDYDDPPESDTDGDPALPGIPINCFPGDSEVQLAHGVIKAFRRWYDGELAELRTDSGKTVRATPNHPVLTRRGWVAIGELQLSDDVLEIADESLLSHERHENNEVASIGEVFAALEVRDIARSVRLEAADFHGDAREGDVDVVLAARPLTFGVLACSAQGTNDLSLTEPGEPTPRQRAPLEILKRQPHSTHRRVSSIRERSPVLSRHPSHAQVVCLRSSADVDPKPLQPRSQRHACDTGALGDREQTLPRLVSGDDRRHVDVEHRTNGTDPIVGLQADSPEFLAQVVGVDAKEARHLLQGLPALQKFVRVRSVDRLAFSGHVFNLETATGWYAIEGILAHNCRCIALPVIESLEGEDDEEEPTETEEPDEGDEAAE